jgi:nucleoside-triphosphatase THEP1
MGPRGAVYVLTGERGTGKTLVCTQLVAAARARGLDVAGIVTGRSGPEPGDPRQVVDLRSGESRPFGAKTSHDDASTSSNPLTPGWEYEGEVFDWANEALGRATPCDLLIVDEVGPLELEGGRGWMQALAVLRSRDFGAALVVCRPSLLDDLEASLGAPPAGVFEASLERSDALTDTIMEEVLG